MDLDVFVARHDAQWRRLEQLAGRAGRRRGLSGAELDELVDLYQRVATHLSVVRSSTPDVALLDRLSRLVAQARSAVAGAKEPPLREILRFLTITFPAAVWVRRWWAAGATAGSLAVAVAVAWWVAGSQRVQNSIAAPEQIRQLVDKDFESYYSSNPAGSFALQVWTNNAWIGLVAIAFGIALGLPTLYVLFQNALNVGIAGGLMIANGKGTLFFGLILPHGLLELTAVFVAAGAGLRVGWRVIDPGIRRRGEAVATEGRQAITVGLGLILVLLVSGIIEAFVTPSPLPTAARISIGVLALGGFLTYVTVFGRRAVAVGELGDLEAGQAGDLLPVA